MCMSAGFSPRGTSAAEAARGPDDNAELKRCSTQNQDQKPADLCSTEQSTAAVPTWSVAVLLGCIAVPGLAFGKHCFRGLPG